MTILKKPYSMGCKVGLVPIESMGCNVGMTLCGVCKKATSEVTSKDKPVVLDSVRFTSVSFVSVSDKSIREAADHAGVTEERMRDYLSSEEQNSELLKAYHYITGCCPVGKTS